MFLLLPRYVTSELISLASPAPYASDKTLPVSAGSQYFSAYFSHHYTALESLLNVSKSIFHWPSNLPNISARPQTSTPTKGEYASWELKKEVPRAMGEGDQPRLSQLLMARSSLEEIELPDDPVITRNLTLSS